MFATKLHEKRGELVTQARAILDEIKPDMGESDVKERETRHDAVMAQLDQLDAQIKREERQMAAEKSGEEYRSQRRPTGEDRETRASGDHDIDDKGKSGDRAEEYRAVFDHFLREGTADMSREQRALLRAGYQKLGEEQRVQVAGTTTSGGYTVPKTMANEIVKTMKDWGPMYDGDVVRDIVTGSGNEFDIPTNDDTGNSASALAEGADLTDDDSGDLTFGQKRLDAYVDATPWVKISFELMQDSAFNLEQFLSEAIGERLGRRANLRLTTGTGTSQPNGVVTASTLGKTAAAAAAITAEEVMDLQHSVRAPYRRSPKCRWMFADTTLLTLRKLKDGQGNFLWQMGDVRIGAPDVLLGKPYSINDDIAAIGASAKAILFGDFGKYWVRKVGAPMIGTVRERFWPKIGMAGLIRFDGELVDSIAIKHLALAAS